ncbi:uncharacterized protein LOC107785658 [Nicotiana tabacum]|uniref:Uncharacterized protein LOC107785658 n=2 Tax=Nicotiana tabacum TaxID=4097 RepID=A0AC58UF66_TOBAC|nr:uncharacterized protein LOC104117064 [Nicotiana tomentosiformis]XP_016462493.1 PREDICTED: uncharacterized protein LOC107785658 [Nicotiana tabacum]
MAAIVCYGPLIDLSKAAVHIGEYVQLLVLVHNIIPIQYKLWRKGGAEVIRTDIQVGDDSRPFFPVSIWQKHLASKFVAGDVILLQNVKITRVGGLIEARTVHCSTLQCVVRSYKSLVSKGGDELLRSCRIGVAAKDKLLKIVRWLQQGAAVELNDHQRKQPSINWKVHEETKSQGCVSLKDLSNLPDSSKVTLYASVGEVFLPITWRHLPESATESMFISKRLYMHSDCDVADDLITAGCHLCGTPLSYETSSGSVKNAASLYCQESSNHLHVVSTIYRPFMLYVWDDSMYAPLLVKNKAAEVLFGNIRAEEVLSCYKRLKDGIDHAPNLVFRRNGTVERTVLEHNAAGEGIAVTDKSTNEGKELKENNKFDLSPNFYLVWLILLKLLLQQENNSPLKFKVTINATRDCEYGRYEMISVSLPSFTSEFNLV